MKFIKGVAEIMACAIFGLVIGLSLGFGMRTLARIDKLEKDMWEDTFCL